MLFRSFGAMASAVALYGISLLYGVAGSLNLEAIGDVVEDRGFTLALAVALVMIVAGLGFKVAAAPFHFWAPDAYQGAPGPVAALVASAGRPRSGYASTAANPRAARSSQIARTRRRACPRPRASAVVATQVITAGSGETGSAG